MGAAAVRLRIDLAYDGSAFRGFARQPRQPTVQGALEDALARLFGTPVSTTAAGRTDAGVHALGQVVHCDVPAAARALGDLERTRAALGRMSGPAVTIWRVRRVPATFDARFSAVERRYVYRLCAAPAMPPLWRHDTWQVTVPLDDEAMRAAAAVLVGEHDFASFCRRAGDQHLVRRVTDLSIARGAQGLVRVRVHGQAFCHQMVRSLVGTLVQVGNGRRRPAWVGEVLRARDRHAAGPVAPPHGLTLVGVRYGRAVDRPARTGIP